MGYQRDANGNAGPALQVHRTTKSAPTPPSAGGEAKGLGPPTAGGQGRQR